MVSRSSIQRVNQFEAFFKVALIALIFVLDIALRVMPSTAEEYLYSD